MSDLTYTNPTLTNPADKSEIEANFADVASTVNGALDTGNMSGTAGFTNSQLANSDYEFLVHFSFNNADIAAVDGTTTPAFLVAIPGTSTDGTYTVLSGAWTCRDVGGQTQDFTVTWGNFNADGSTWDVTTTIATVTNLAGLGGANTVGHGSITISGATLTLEASDPMFIGVNFPNAIDGTVLSAATDRLDITLKLRRTDGLR